MDGKKIYGLTMGGVGLFFIGGLIIFGYQNGTNDDKQIILFWGFVFTAIGLLSFFWENINGFNRQLGLKLFPSPPLKKNNQPKKVGWLTRLMVEYYSRTEKSERSAAHIASKTLSKTAQKKLKRNRGDKRPGKRRH